MSKRSVAAVLLTLEAVVIALAIPVALALSDVSASVAVPVGLGVALLSLAAAGALGRPAGYALGWVVQVLAIALGFIVPTMFVLGAIFALLWLVTLRLGKTIEEDPARRETQ